MCIMMVGYVMKLIPIIYIKEASPVLTSSIGAVTEYNSSKKNNDAFRKRMELFHYE